MSSPRPAAERQRTGVTTRTETEQEAIAAPSVPGFLDRQRAARPWLDHLVRAGQSYQQHKGDYYAAGITYFSVLALVPLIMVLVAAAAIVLAGDQDLLNRLNAQIAGSVPGAAGEQVSELVTTAIDDRGAVGVVGLLLGVYAGLGWIGNIRNALTAQWDQQPPDQSFLRTKLVDLGALAGLFLALVVSFGLSGIGGAGSTALLERLGLDDVPGVFLLTSVLAIVLSIGATWAVFTWVISHLPRAQVTTRSAARAGLLAAVVFEVFKQVGVIYLRTVTDGAAFAAFGPVIGILVFVFITSRLLLFATAFAATAEGARRDAPVPGPAVITTSLLVSPGPSVRGVAAGVVLGAAAAVGWDRLRRR